MEPYTFIYRRYRFADLHNANDVFDQLEVAAARQKQILGGGPSARLPVMTMTTLPTAKRVSTALKTLELTWGNAEARAALIPPHVYQWTQGEGDSMLCKGHPTTICCTAKLLIANRLPEEVPVAAVRVKWSIPVRFMS